MRRVALGLALALAGSAGTAAGAPPAVRAAASRLDAGARLELAPRRSGRDPSVLEPSRSLARVALTPARGELRSRGEGSLTADERARRDAAIEALVAAEARATESPETAEGPLVDALQGFAEVALLVSDDLRAQEARAYALLALARTRLVLERPADAEATLDEALATIRGRALPIEQFGPALQALFDQRVAAGASVALASLTVRCSVPCRVLVDEQAFTDALVPGVHRVWVEALEPGLPVLRRTLRLSPGESVELVYEVDVPKPLPPAPVVAAPRRVLPRWASVLGVATGAGVAAAGGALVGVDHRCPDLSDPREVPCLRILNTDAGGFALLGVGSALVISAAVILTIDEVRARRARRPR